MLKVVEGHVNYGVCLLTTEPIARGTIFFRIDHYREVDQPTYQTIQVGVNKHIEELGVIAHLNHSCHPNVIIHAPSMTCLTTRDVAAGEELSFFYPSTEWEMDRPFDCQCGDPGCVGMVAGAKHMAVDVLSKFYINEHIRTLIQMELTATEGQFLALADQLT